MPDAHTAGYCPAGNSTRGFLHRQLVFSQSPAKPWVVCRPILAVLVPVTSRRTFTPAVEQTPLAKILLPSLLASLAVLRDADYRQWDFGLYIGFDAGGAH